MKASRGSAFRWVMCLLLGSAGAAGAQVAATPPLGWNSWDSYGLSITAAEWKANVDWFHAHLQPAGWQYVVLDEGWYLAHPENAGGKGDQGYMLNAAGQFVPAPVRFPAGVAGLARDAHAMGLKFGLHIIRGIPKLAVERNTAIAAGMHAADAADTSDTCRWNPDNYGVRDNAAGQAYYDGLMRLYAGWGVDFLKVDCIAKPYNAHEIRMLRSAIDKTGRPMVLSLSPGPTPLADAADVSAKANLWRISDDVWDVWSDAKLTPDSFPETVRNQFDVLAKWMPYQRPGHWPDADMLPVGTLGPRPGWGEARESRFTEEETRSLLTLWSIARCPLVLGANLTKVSPELEAALTNKLLLEVDQHASESRELLRDGDTVVWSAKAAGGGMYFAVFNLRESEAAVRLPWEKLGLGAGAHAVQDVWADASLGSQTELGGTLRKHASMLVRVR